MYCISHDLCILQQHNDSNVDRNAMNKTDLLISIRNEANKILTDISNIRDEKKKAAEFNKRIVKKKDIRLNQMAKKQPDPQKLLDLLLLTSYAYYVVMLEYRNAIWKYDYMAFSRRIGELWEPFCKIAFDHPLNSLSFFEPPLFTEIQDSMQAETKEYIYKLEIPEEQKKDFTDYYLVVWDMIDSSNINMSLDMHFKQNDRFYNVDFKSGFSSNEKGNTNRLLQVAGIYAALSNKYECMIFVRQPEDENNHYLQTLKNSPHWEVFCAEDAYSKMKEFTGFDLKQWMTQNIDWMEDFSQEFADYIRDNDLTKYLTW